MRLFRFRCRLSQSYIITPSLSTSRVNDVDNFRPQALKKCEISCFKIRVIRTKLGVIGLKSENEVISVPLQIKSVICKYAKLSSSRVNDIDNFRAQASKKCEISCFKTRVAYSVHAVAQGCSEPV